jgi:hypothetical protein
VSLVELVAFDDEVGARVDDVVDDVDEVEEEDDDEDEEDEEEEDEEEEDEEDEDDEELLLPSPGPGTGTMACAAESRLSCRTIAPTTARRGLRTEGVLREVERIGPTECCGTGGPGSDRCQNHPEYLENWASCARG